MKSKSRFKNSVEHCERAASLRKQAPLTERLVWEALTSLRKETGLKFRRQHPLHPYIADFACIKAKLIIELDGPSHDNSMAYDAKRDTFLEKHGWTVLRYSNQEVLSNLDGVVMEIIEKAKARVIALP